MLEICCYSLESCVNAQVAGIQRIELCASDKEGGITPSIGMMAMARSLYTGEIYVMIRPRGGDFLYSNLEFELMKTEIRLAQSIGIDGFVFGILNPDGSIDQERISELVELAQPLKVCFHRAFDLCIDPLDSLEQIITCGCHRILTSARCNKAIEGLSFLKEIVMKADNRIEIMAGSGVNPSNAEAILHTGVQAIHASAKKSRPSLMTYMKKSIQMGTEKEILDIGYADIETMLELAHIVSNSDKAYSFK